MTTTQEARRLKQALAAQERGRGKRYDKTLRARIVAFAEQRRAEGESWGNIATELGARFETLRRWCQGRRPEPTRALAVRPVEIVAAARGGGTLAVVSRSGLRVEGVTLDDAIAILRTLG